MSGITALGTTYNLPNYTGILHLLTPADVPFFSAIGGLSGGGQTTATQFEWQTEDLRAMGQNVALEGQDAPTDQNRVRASVNNVCQIHQETVGVSYTKQAAYGQHSGLNIEAPNPITKELDHQTQLMLKQMLRDINWSFINGSYQLPTDNTTARKTRGLLSAITSTVQSAGTFVGNAATAGTGDTFTIATHGLNNGDQVVLDTIVTTTGISADTPYYVVNSATNTFKVSATKGGAAIDLVSDGTANVTKSVMLTVDTLGALMQSVFDNGGLTESPTGTIIVNSSQKRAITTAYGNAFGKYMETNRNVGGVNMETIETDFGRLNIMLDRAMPKHKIAVVSLEQCMPVYLEVPGKGHFFAEPLAKTGAKDRVQLYGEVGLAYGNEKAHGYATGFIV